MTAEILSEQPETPFHDLDHYLAIPRVSGLALSPDGARLVTTVATLNARAPNTCTALWEAGPGGAEAGPPDHPQRQGGGRRRVRGQRRPLLHVRPARSGKPADG